MKNKVPDRATKFPYPGLYNNMNQGMIDALTIALETPYLPKPYVKWIDQSKIEKYAKGKMGTDSYDMYVTQTLPIVCEFTKRFDETVNQIKDSPIGFVEENKKNDRTSNINDPTYECRLIYDILILKKILAFWIEVLKQPRETIGSFFNQNRPDMKLLVEEIEKEYELADAFPAEKIIKVYKF